MKVELPSLNAPLQKSEEVKTFDNLYKHKYVNRSLASIAHKNQIIAAQLRPEKSQSLSQFNFFNEKPVRKRSKTIGSLLPKLKELEAIQKSEKKNQKNAKKQINIDDPPNEAVPLSKLDVYFSAKNINKQQQSNMIFLTSAAMGKTIPDKILNDRFQSFVTKKASIENKFLRGILGHTEELNEQQKKQLLGKQKSQLKDVVREMIAIHHGQAEKIATQISKNKEGGPQVDQEEEEYAKVGDEKKKNINWVLQQCMRYDKKFKGKKISPIKSLKATKKSSQSIEQKK